MTIDKKDLIAIRDYTPEDHNFILSTWLKGLKFGNSWFNLIDQTAYYKVYHTLIENILARSGTEVKVAVLKDEPEFILGYSVLRKNQTIADWVFCKSTWRGIGIANMLVPKTVKQISHLTKTGEFIFKKRANLSFNPFE